MASPTVTKDSQATRPVGSCLRTSSSTASEIWSQTLSGCPSVTDSDVKKYLPLPILPPLLDQFAFWRRFPTDLGKATEKLFVLHIIEKFAEFGKRFSGQIHIGEFCVSAHQRFGSRRADQEPGSVVEDDLQTVGGAHLPDFEAEMLLRRAVLDPSDEVGL